MEQGLANLVDVFERNTEIELVFLRGSILYRYLRRCHDIDLLVISKAFKFLNHYERKRIISRMCSILPVKIDSICLTPSEYQRYQRSVVFRQIELQLFFIREEDR